MRAKHGFLVGTFQDNNKCGINSDVFSFVNILYVLTVYLLNIE